MANALRRWVKSILEQNNENELIESVLRDVDKNTSILDVGCGDGRNLLLLNGLGFSDVLGVDINGALVERAKEKGFNAVTVDEFDEIGKKEYGLVLFSHVVEHFSYLYLLEFVEKYLGFCEKGGKVIVVTPLYNSSFYDDFDHVKPYHPDGFRHVFSSDSYQIQFQSKYVLDILDIHFRRMPFYVFKFNRLSYLGRINYPVVFVNVFFGIIFRLTRGVLGRTTGWCALYVLSDRK